MAEESTDGDSRTSVVGRKRDLHDSNQYEGATEDGSLNQSRKRLKRNLDPAVTVEEIDSTSVQVTSALPIHEEDEVSASSTTTRPAQSLQPARSNLQGPIESTVVDEAMGGAPLPDLDRNMEGSAIGGAPIDLSNGQSVDLKPAKLASNMSESASSSHVVPLSQSPSMIQEPAQASARTAPSTGWNQGVQSNLRTTFGSKLRTGFGNKKTSLDTPQLTSPKLTQAREADNQGPIDEAPDFTVTSPVSRSSPSDLARMLARHQYMFEKPIKVTAGEKSTNTQEVDKALMLEKTWPLPCTYDSLDVLVAGGQTYYPTNFSQPPKPYTWGGHSFDFPILLNELGFPYKAWDISFNTFAPSFVKLNISKISNLKNAQLRTAFNFYHQEFYSHAFETSNKVRATAKASSALNLEQALDAAEKLRSVVGCGALAQPSVSDGGPSAAALSTVKYMAEGKGQAVAITVPTSVNSLSRETSQLQIQKTNRPPNQETIIIDDSDDDPYTRDTTHEDIEIAEDEENKVEGRAPLPSHLHGAPDIVHTGKTKHDSLQMALQSKYFPGGNDSIRKCLACGDLGHWQTACPALNCTICGEIGKHSNFTCPANQRCEKCYSRGHPSTTCPQKLKATREEAGDCDICGARDHVEGSCHYIWRSFAPKPEEIKTVREIPVHCYNCGESGHYGPQCGLHSGPLLSGNYTWSQDNVRKYVDPHSQNRAISAGIDYSLPKKMQKQKEFSIKGKGRANDPFTIDDSDGDDDFIRPKISQGAQRGHIHFGENRHQQFNQGSHRSHDAIGLDYLGDNMQYNVAPNRDDNNTSYYGNVSQSTFPTFGQVAAPPSPPPPPGRRGKGRISRATKAQRRAADPRPRHQKPDLSEGSVSHMGEPRAGTTASSAKKNKKARRRAAAALAAQNGS